MTHKDEICRWSKCKDGTKVWYRVKESKDKKWRKIRVPSWKEHNYYVIDDEWAEIRKQFIDDKSKVLVKSNKSWIVTELDNVSEFGKGCYTVEKYKIKPECLYQWIYREKGNTNYRITSCHYKTKEEALKVIGKGVEVEVIPYEPSKIEVL